MKEYQPSKSNQRPFRPTLASVMPKPPADSAFIQAAAILWTPESIQQTEELARHLETKKSR